MQREQFHVPYGPGIFVNAVFMDKAIELIDQIHEPQKVVVPKFVAEWIEIHKKSFSEASAIDMYDNLTSDNRSGYYHEVWLWVIAHHHDFIKAWHDGFEIEQEQLFTVRIPNPNRPDIVTFLYKENGKVFIGSDIFLDEVPNYKWERLPENQLTEVEIKEDFEWAWQFAKEVK
ncbi:TPA: DUF1642 domain-containing protein [Streptococcus suis]